MKYYFNCPKCQSDEGFSVPSEESTSHGWMIFILGGFIPALLYADATRGRVQCSQCGLIFRQPRLPRTSLSIFATWIMGIVLVVTLLSGLMWAIPQIPRLVPDHPLISQIEGFVADNPRVIVLSFLPAMALLFLISLIASFVSNRKAHRELRKHYETKPKTFSEVKGSAQPKEIGID